jgi:hypothetical protein
MKRTIVTLLAGLAAVASLTFAQAPAGTAVAGVTTCQDPLQWPRVICDPWEWAPPTD